MFLSYVKEAATDTHYVRFGKQKETQALFSMNLCFFFHINPDTCQQSLLHDKIDPKRCYPQDNLRLTLLFRV